MGISNDIKPRKVYYPGNSHSNRSRSKASDDLLTPDPKFDKKEKEVPVQSGQEDQGERKENLKNAENDFFSHYDEPEKPATGPSLPKIKIIRISPGKILAGIFLILIIVMVVQNFSVIKGFIVPNQNKSGAPTNTPVKPIEYVSNDGTSTDATSTSNTPSSNSATAATANPTPTPTPTPAPSIALQPTSDKAAVKLKVLNGNGIAGTAATVTNQLTAAGFTVTSTTNAKSFAYASTIVYYKTGKSAEAELVKAAITGRTITTELNNTAPGEMDVVVVVGKK